MVISLWLFKRAWRVKGPKQNALAFHFVDMSVRGNSQNGWILLISASEFKVFNLILKNILCFIKCCLNTRLSKGGMIIYNLCDEHISIQSSSLVEPLSSIHAILNQFIDCKTFYIEDCHYMAEILPIQH